MGVWDSVKQRFKAEEKKFPDELETEDEYKSRWRSIYIIYFTMFLVCLGISLVFTSIWPYLDKVDPTAGKTYMGYIVSAHPLGQMIFSPLVGWWCNKSGSIRMPLMSTMVIFGLANILYSSVEVFSVGIKHWMLASRFLVGISSANVVALRTYLSAATRSSERRKAIVMYSLAQIMGLIIGPAVQVAAVPFGNDGSWLIPNYLRINMYTVGGWISVLLAVGNLLLLLPGVFHEHNIAEREATLQQGGTSLQTANSPVCKITAWSLIMIHFVLVLNFMIVEALGSSIAMDHFAFTKAESLSFMGLVMTVGAGLTIFVYMIIDPLCKWLGEVNVMIWCGVFFMTVSRFFFIPMGSHTPLTFDEGYRLDVLNNLTICHDDIKANPEAWNVTRDDLEDPLYLNNLCNYTEIVGCPSSQAWCFTANAITINQFIFSNVVVMLSFPLGLTLMHTIFSRVLGTRPQGIWMGYMTSSGSISRIVGPVLVTHIYTILGPNWAFGSTFLMLCCTTTLMWVYSDYFVVPGTIQTNEELTESKPIVTHGDEIEEIKN